MRRTLSLSHPMFSIGCLVSMYWCAWTNARNNGGWNITSRFSFALSLVRFILSTHTGKLESTNKSLLIIFFVTFFQMKVWNDSIFLFQINKICLFSHLIFFVDEQSNFLFEKKTKMKIKHASIQPNIYLKSTKFNMAAKSDRDVWTACSWLVSNWFRLLFPTIFQSQMKLFFFPWKIFINHFPYFFWSENKRNSAIIFRFYFRYLFNWINDKKSFKKWICFSDESDF